MKKYMTMLAVLTAALFVTGALFGQEKKQEKGKGKEKGKAKAASVFQFPAEITPTDEQKEKLAEIQKEWGSKLAAAQKKVDSILTDEQRKARTEAQKQAKSAGKKGKEFQDDVDAAMKLTDEQKKEMVGAGRELRELQAQIREKINGLLTDEQKAKLPKVQPKKRKKDGQ